MKITFISLFCLFFFLLQAKAQNNFWSPADATALNARQDVFAKNYRPAKFLAFTLNENSFFTELKTAPSEKTVSAGKSTFIISVPNAAGKIERFRVVEAPVMEPGLAAKHPEIRTYAGQGIDEPSSVIRFDITPQGFHGMILSAVRKTIYINPVDKINHLYIVFDRDGLAKENTIFHCTTPDAGISKGEIKNLSTAKNITDGYLRTYRFAVASGGEFSQLLLDGTETSDAERKSNVLAGIVSDLTRANGINETDFGVRLLLVDAEDTIIFLDGATDPFLSKSSGINGTWNTQSQKAIDSLIGNNNYDIGHLLMGYNTGGNAYEIGSVCKSATKGTGVTGLLQPTGDPFTVDFWDHEIGHQFGDNHTFDFEYEGTGAQMEPGSGSTIMAYAGVTGQYDIQPHSDPYFHAYNINQTANYITTGAGAGCAVLTSAGDNAPTANAGADYIIPISTPFALTATATDADVSDALTYCWEQYDSYVNDNSDGPFPDSSFTNGPVFRSLNPVISPTRLFPQLSSILDGTNKNKWEALPAVARTMNFKVTVRDNHPGGGQNNSDAMKVTVSAVAGPFKVISPNTAVTWYAGDFKTVKWNVANTNKVPVNCSSVDIFLSTDGGQTFPVTLASNTPNDGSQEIHVPDNLTSNARIKVSAHRNIFFDIDDKDFTIANSPTAEFVFNHPDTLSLCYTGSSFSQTLQTGSLAGFSTPITLSATGNPAGSNIVFGTNPVTPNSNTTVTLSGNISPGIYTINVKGIAGAVTKNQDIVFNLISLNSATALLSPANAAIGVDTLPVFSWNHLANAANYLLEISTSPSFNTVIQSINNITDTSYTLTTPLAGNTQYYWRVTASDDCGKGAAFATSVFKTALIQCNDYTSTDVPKTISPNGTSTINSTLTVADNFKIADVNVVALNGTHTYINDLEFTLKSPAGTKVILFDQICGSQNNFSLNLDDQASTTVFPCPPVGGVTVTPQQPLSGFNGETSNGIWTLTVNDLADGDGGQLLGWGLKMCSATATALPVNWLSFTAEKSIGNSVLLNWATANEINNDHYEIEKSGDGINFTTLGSVAGGSQPNMTEHYFYTDVKPFNGNNFYRLKQVDKDGQFKYSAIVKINMQQTGNLWLVYPNPATNKTTVQIQEKLQGVSISLSDITGKKMYNLNLPNADAGQTIDIPLSNLARGIYILKVESDKGIKTNKIVVN